MGGNQRPGVILCPACAAVLAGVVAAAAAASVVFVGSRRPTDSCRGDNSWRYRFSDYAKSPHLGNIGNVASVIQ